MLVVSLTVANGNGGLRTAVCCLATVEEEKDLLVWVFSCVAAAHPVGRVLPVSSFLKNDRHVVVFGWSPNTLQFSRSFIRSNVDTSHAPFSFFFLCGNFILKNWFLLTGPVMFHVRRRPADGGTSSQQQQAAQRRRKKKLSGGSTGGGGNNQPAASAQSVNRLVAETGEDVLPYLVELNPDGSEVRQGANQPIRRHVISSSTVTEVGSERPATSPAAGK